MQQIWKDVKDFEGLYQVSNLGRVKSSYKSKKILKGFINEDGYVQVALFKKGNKEQPCVHKLVFEAFYRRLLPNEDCHHINQVRDCNISTNLVARDNFEHNSYHHKGQVSYFKGKKRPQQTVDKVRATKIKNGTLNMKRTVQSIQKQMQSRRRNGNLKHSEESKKKMSQIKKQWWVKKKAQDQ